MKKHLLRLLCAIFATLAILPTMTSALTPEERSLFRNSGIIVYDPYGNNCITGGGDLMTSDERAAAIAGSLAEAGYNDTSIAAILGSLKAESGFNPKILEGGAIVDDNFRAWNGGKTFKGGFGIVQWTSKGRVKNLQEYADSNGLPVTSLEAQVGFMLQEIAGAYGLTPEKLNGLDLAHATYKVWAIYETPGASFRNVNGKSVIYTFEESQKNKSFLARLGYAADLLGIDPSDAMNLAGGGVCLPIGSSSDLPILPLNEPSDNIPCDPRTIDRGVIHDAAINGRLISIRICEVPNIPNYNSNKTGISNTGGSLVNARVAGAFFALAEAARAAGLNITANSAYRSYSQQVGAGCLNPNRDPNRVGSCNGSYHRSGLAIDFNMTGCVAQKNHTGYADAECRTGSSRLYDWMHVQDNAARFGFSKIASEHWHFDPRNYTGPSGAVPGSDTINSPNPANIRISNNYAFPVYGITSRSPNYRSYHKTSTGAYRDAADISAPQGTPVLAITSGTIANLKVNTISNGGRTNCTPLGIDPSRDSFWLKGDDGYTYYYTHLTPHSTTVAGITNGKRVAAGTVLGSVGGNGAGDCRGSHLHISASPTSAGGKAVDDYAGSWLTHKLLPGLP